MFAPSVEVISIVAIADDETILDRTGIVDEVVPTNKYASLTKYFFFSSSYW